jgi:hypothetical protein
MKSARWLTECCGAEHAFRASWRRCPTCGMDSPEWEEGPEPWAALDKVEAKVQALAQHTPEDFIRWMTWQQAPCELDTYARQLQDCATSLMGFKEVLQGLLAREREEESPRLTLEGLRQAFTEFSKRPFPSSEVLAVVAAVHYLEDHWAKDDRSMGKPDLGRFSYEMGQSCSAFTLELRVASLQHCVDILMKYRELLLEMVAKSGGEPQL